MAVNQIYQIVNALNSYANKGAQTAVVDTRSFIDYGKTVLSSETNVETFFKELWDRIATTIIDNRAYNPQFVNGLWREEWEYGAIMQKLHVKMPNAVNADSYNDIDDMPDDPFAIFPFEVEQRMFSKISAFDVDGSYPDVQLKTAFTSEQKMAAFIDAMQTVQLNAMARSIENLGCTCRSALAATCIDAGGAKYVKLLTEYKALYPDDAGIQAMTAADALYDREFLRYASYRIAVVIDQLKVLSTVHAGEGYERFTPDTYLNAVFLNEFDKSVSSYLASVTYHESLVSLPDDNKIVVPYWQGSESQFGFGSTSEIKLTIDDGTENGSTIEKQYIIGMVYDSEAAGICIDERRTRSIYNPRNEVTNIFMKARQMYYIDATQNAVVFVID